MAQCEAPTRDRVHARLRAAGWRVVPAKPRAEASARVTWSPSPGEVGNGHLWVNGEHLGSVWGFEPGTPLPQVRGHRDGAGFDRTVQGLLACFAAGEPWGPPFHFQTDGDVIWRRCGLDDPPGWRRVEEFPSPGELTATREAESAEHRRLRVAGRAAGRALLLAEAEALYALPEGPQTRADAEASARTARLLVRAGWAVGAAVERPRTLRPVAGRFRHPLGMDGFALYLGRKLRGVVVGLGDGPGADPRTSVSPALFGPLVVSRSPGRTLDAPYYYQTDGVNIHFLNALTPDPGPREVAAFHAPDELERLLRERA